MALGSGTPYFGVDEGGVGRAAVRGGIIALVTVFAFATGIGLSAGFDLAGAVGLGLFAGFWGGPGFGGMLGATLHIIRAQGHEAPSPVSRLGIASGAPATETSDEAA